MKIFPPIDDGWLNNVRLMSLRIGGAFGNPSVEFGYSISHIGVRYIK